MKSRLSILFETRQFKLFILFVILLDLTTIITSLLLEIYILEPHTPPNILPSLKAGLHSMELLSFTIVTFMLLEISLKIFAFGVKFFKSVINILDLIVVLISFSLELAGLINSSVLTPVASVIVLARIWRFLRIVHGGVDISIESNLERGRDHRVHELESRI